MNMKPRYIYLAAIALISAFLLPAGAAAQTEKMNVDADTSIKKIGPNRAHFVWMMTDFQFYGSSVSAPGYQLRGVGAFGAQALLMYKRKLSNVFSLVGGVGISSLTLYISNNKPSQLDTLFWNKGVVNHDKERMATNYATGTAGLRINMDPKRGDVQGTYLEFGGSGGLLIATRYYTKDKGADGRVIKTTMRKLPYYEPYTYSAYARLGLKGTVVVGVAYRFSDYFKSKYQLPEPGKFAVTLSLNLGG